MVLTKPKAKKVRISAKRLVFASRPRVPVVINTGRAFSIVHVSAADHQSSNKGTHSCLKLVRSTVLVARHTSQLPIANARIWKFAVCELAMFVLSEADAFACIYWALRPAPHISCIPLPTAALVATTPDEESVAKSLARRRPGKSGASS